MKRHQEITEEDFFELTMNRKWDDVVEVYRSHPLAHTIKLTKSEETALHIAISLYDSEEISSYERWIKDMISCFPQDKLFEILSMPNDKGNTPLHLAAAVGCETICDFIASKDRDLMARRNIKGETPMFVAAYHGKLKAFLRLHETYNQERDPDESLCRRYDGNTILHSSISGEYFRLAYQIISYYPKLVNSVNAEGESPLHVLAKKPNVFKSSIDLGVYDSIIYRCVSVEELKKQEYVPETYRINGHSINYPENYGTCVDIIRLLWAPIHKIVTVGHDSRTTNRHDEESRQEAKYSEEESKYTPFLRAIYRTCILPLKFAMTVILTVLGGYDRIKMTEEMKQRQVDAIRIMNKLIQLETTYNYSKTTYTNWRTPLQERIEILDSPPDLNLDYQSKDKKKEYPNTSVMNETPVLIAAMMGIPEMVEGILSRWPVAIHDLDSKGKNVLMLAAENRQTRVFKYLLKIKLPQHAFYQVDDDGNSILHLAAMLGPWDIPGAALQMQWELKWYQHVKDSIPPQSYAHNNKRGETPTKIFTTSHKPLVKEGTDWLIKTCESCSLIAALVATVAFATSATVPGGLDQTKGHPIMKNHTTFDIFSICSLAALSLSITALFFFLAIITSSFREQDFEHSLPGKLFLGLTALFASIAVMLVSFCAGHTFILSEELRLAAVSIYTIACIPVMVSFAIVQLPLYFDLVRAMSKKLPLRSYKVF